MKRNLHKLPIGILTVAHLPTFNGNVYMDAGNGATQEAKAGWSIKQMSTLLLLGVIVCLSIPDGFAADELGRLFTTPQQRSTLEKLRYQKPVEEKKPEQIFTETEPEEEMEKPVIGGITVNGLVYRNNGKSTAWINSANTNEGNFGNQYIQIDAHNIKPDDVEILIPINDAKIKLKTGETYDPETDQIISPGYQDN